MHTLAAHVSTFLTPRFDRLGAALALLALSTVLAAPAVLDAHHGVALVLVTTLLASAVTGLVLPLVMRAAPGPHAGPPCSGTRPKSRTGLVTDIPRSPLCPRAPGGR